jgi:hypothetical protein
MTRVLPWFAASILTLACSSSDPAPSTANTTGGAPAATGGAAPGTGGATGGSKTTGGAATATGGVAMGTGGTTGGSAPTGGAPAVTGGAPSSTGGAASGAGGVNGGSGGNSGSAGGGAPSTAGKGGGGAGAGGAGGAAAGGPSGGGSSDIVCPTGATFCSGFEGTALPAGTKFHAVGPTDAMTYKFDTENPKFGKQSLSIPEHSGGFYYRALAVPVPGNDFWVRLYVRVSRAFGDDGHDSLFGASNGNLDADVNGEALVEFSEQFNEVLLNTDDQLFNPSGMSTLSANAWHCIEAHYEGGSGNVQIFSDGMEIINAPGYAKATFQTFRIGYMQYHDTRGVWYDDVVVAPARVNCQ